MGSGRGEASHPLSQSFSGGGRHNAARIVGSPEKMNHLELEVHHLVERFNPHVGDRDEVLPSI